MSPRASKPYAELTGYHLTTYYHYAIKWRHPKNADALHRQKHSAKMNYSHLALVESPAVKQ
jgi:hypothetical protein